MTIKQIVAVNLVDGVVDAAGGGWGGRRGGDDHQDAAAGRQERAVVGALGTHVADAFGEIGSDFDRGAFRVTARIALGGHHDAENSFVAPAKRGNRAGRGDGLKDIVDVILEARQHHFRFGVPETGIEFDDLDARRGLHQAAVEHAGKWRAGIGHGIGHRLQDV